jgi:hypothetical protein
MTDGYKFKIEYEMLQDDENLDDDSKVRFITYGNTAIEAVKNHGQILHAWDKFLEKKAKKIAVKEKNELR